MIPTMSFDESELEIIDEELPSLTHKMRFNENRVVGKTDDVDAVKQAIYKILNTERYDHPEIYSSNYGVEFKELFGKPVEWVIPVLTQRIIEALTWDDRILRVYNFDYDVKKKIVHVTFYVDTIFGTTKIDDLEVQI